MDRGRVVLIVGALVLVSVQAHQDPVSSAAGIAGEEDATVTGELGCPLAVRCRAYGYPPPAIFWYRGRGGAMVPFYTGAYEAHGQELLIRRLSLDTLGEYECQAYNGMGKVATWRVTVQAWQSEGTFGQYLVPREPMVVPVTTSTPIFTIPPYTVSTEIETNEVVPDCETYVKECARMTCPFGVQRVRTRDGCDRCSCVQQEVDCTLTTECDCHYGLARSTGEDGCDKCECLENPCSGKACPEGERCVATPFRDPVTDEQRYSTDCKAVNKTGVCHVDISNIVQSTETTCRHECTDDLDCRGVLKCCARACSHLCLAPVAPTSPPVSTTHAPDVPLASQASTKPEPEITAAEGGKATLRCIFHGNPPPLITWRFGQITVPGHKSRQSWQEASLPASYVLPGGEGTGWGEWGEVSPCSRTCGGGVASQRRICLKIRSDGQPQCTGGDTKYFSCQTQDCPAGSMDFREEQCSEFDNVTFMDVKYKWVSYTHAPNPCELNCMPQNERFYYRHRTKVVDGTRCNDESFDVCVNGTCQSVGCDLMLGSTAREDKCRECRGNGANCQTIVGVLDENFRTGYVVLLFIPKGATSISIAERAPSNNYLALRAENNTYYLNGEYHIDFPRSLVIAGALWYYERSQQGFAAADKLWCLGPTNENLYLALLVNDVNVGIDYEYSIPKGLAPPRNKRYNWVHEEFTPCSAACRGGYQTRNVSCRSQELEIVDDSLCDRESKPPTNQTCNTAPCAPEWTTGDFGECSKQCGKGVRLREIFCTQVITHGHKSIVPDKSCLDLHGPKPEIYTGCNRESTCPLWFTEPWKPITRTLDRYSITSDGALEITGLHRNDSGVYACVAENDFGIVQQQEITFRVKEAT